MFEKRVTDIHGSKTELDKAGKTQVDLLAALSSLWLSLALIGLKYQLNDLRGVSYVCAYILPSLSLLYHTTIHVNFSVLNTLNRYIAVLTLAGVIVVTDPNKLVLTHVLLCLTLSTRFVYGGCVFRVITKTPIKDHSMRQIQSHKNLQIFIAVVSLGLKIHFCTLASAQASLANPFVQTGDEAQ